MLQDALEACARLVPHPLDHRAQPRLEDVGMRREGLVEVSQHAAAIRWDADSLAVGTTNAGIVGSANAADAAAAPVAAAVVADGSEWRGFFWVRV